MPAWRQRSSFGVGTSWEVRATMGRSGGQGGRGAGGKQAADEPGRAQPVHLRHLDVHDDAVEPGARVCFSPNSSRQASLPLLAATTPCARRW